MDIIESQNLCKIFVWITWYPNHGGDTDHESQDLAPPGVLVVPGVLDGGVLDEVEDEDKGHEGRGDGHPTPVEVAVDPEAEHLFEAAVEFLAAEYPANR